MYKTIKTSIVFILLLSTSACTNTKTKTMFNFLKTYPKYDFNAEACAPKDFPCEIVRGAFYLADDTFLGIPNGEVLGDTGWGGFGAVHVVGPDLKALPIAVAVTWVSYVEKKFYHGKFDLDYELIANYFKEGYIDFEGKQNTFDTVKIGIAPGGYLVVWIEGLGRQVEVGRYKAKETEVTKEEFIPNGVSIKEYIDLVLSEDLPPEYQNENYYNNIPFNKWETYRKKYNFKPVYEFESGGKMDAVTLKYYNGEEIILATEDLVLFTKFQEQALPIYLYLKWLDNNNNPFGAYIFFGARDPFESSEEFKPIEQELFHAFHQLFEEKKAEKAALVFKIDKYNSHIQIFLKSEQDSIELKKMKINTFKRTK